MIRTLRALLIGLLAVLVVLAPGGTATAHDELLSSVPEDGATLEEAPEELVLTFSGQIAQVGAQLQVTDADGEDVADGDPVVEGTDLVQPLTDIGSGDYEVVWRVTSSDGHPISGTFAFTVEVAEEPEETTGAGDGATEDEAAEATPDATQEETDEAEQATEGTSEDSGEEATDDAVEEEATTDGTETEAADDGGLPGWVWAVIGVAVLALVALLARTWSRGRS